MGRPRVKIRVSKQSSHSAASDEFIKVVPLSTLVVRIGTKLVQNNPTFLCPKKFWAQNFFQPNFLDQKFYRAESFWMQKVLTPEKLQAKIFSDPNFFRPFFLAERIASD